MKSVEDLTSEEAPKRRISLLQNFHTMEVTGRTSDKLILFRLMKEVEEKTKDQLTKMLFDRIVSDRALGYLETKILIDAGAKIHENLKPWKWKRQNRLRTSFYEGTCLQCATTFGQLKAMEALIDAGANMEQSSGSTPCALLCSIKYLPAAKLLLKKRG